MHKQKGWIIWCFHLFHKVFEIWSLFTSNWKHWPHPTKEQPNRGEGPRCIWCHRLPLPLKEILYFATDKSMTKCFKWLIIEYNNRILLQILCVKGCSHILMVHLISTRWCGNRKNDVVFSSQIFIHMAFTIDGKMTWMSKISYENVIHIKSFQI